MEEAVRFENYEQETLVGVWHSAPSASLATIVMLHGWSGYRSGPHQMLTRAARAFAALGFNVLRFDFAGRGDSAGMAARTTLATMQEDARAATQWCRARACGQKIILLGLCSGCEVAVAASSTPNLAAQVLWSGPIFAAAQSNERATRRKFQNLRRYAVKLLQPSTYIKLVRGQLDTASIARAASGVGGEARNNEGDEPGSLPPGFRKAALPRFEALSVPLLLVYGTADPTTTEALAWYRARSSGRAVVHEHLVAGANHSFYGLHWEREVIMATSAWLLQLDLQGN